MLKSSAHNLTPPRPHGNDSASSYGVSGKTSGSVIDETEQKEQSLRQIGRRAATESPQQKMMHRGKKVHTIGGVLGSDLMTFEAGQLLGGVGLTLQQDKKGPVYVAGKLPGGPAALCHEVYTELGVHTGRIEDADVLLAIDEEPIIITVFDQDFLQIPQTHRVLFRSLPLQPDSTSFHFPRVIRHAPLALNTALRRAERE